MKERAPLSRAAFVKKTHARANAFSRNTSLYGTAYGTFDDPFRSIYHNSFYALAPPPDAFAFGTNAGAATESFAAAAAKPAALGFFAAKDGTNGAAAFAAAGVNGALAATNVFFVGLAGTEAAGAFASGPFDPTPQPLAPPPTLDPAEDPALEGAGAPSESKPEDFFSPRESLPWFLTLPLAPPEARGGRSGALDAPAPLVASARRPPPAADANDANDAPPVRRRGGTGGIPPRVEGFAPAPAPAALGLVSAGDAASRALLLAAAAAATPACPHASSSASTRVTISDPVAESRFALSAHAATAEQSRSAGPPAKARAGHGEHTGSAAPAAPRRASAASAAHVSVGSGSEAICSSRCFFAFSTSPATARAATTATRATASAGTNLKTSSANAASPSFAAHAAAPRHPRSLIQN